MSAEKPRLLAGLLDELGSVATAAGPDEIVAAVFDFDQAGVDRCREARIVQLDGEVFAASLAGGLLPGRTELDRWAGDDAEVGTALAVALAGDKLGLDVEGQGFDGSGEARAVFVLGEGADGRHCRARFSCRAAPLRPRWGRATEDDRPAPLGAGTKWKTAGDSFFASRCKAEGGGKKLAADVAGDYRGEAGLRSDPCQPRTRMERPFQEIKNTA